MKCILDTHFLLWILLGSSRLREFPWVFGYMPWGISPVSLLEIQLLREVGRIDAGPELPERIAGDARFLLDEVPLVALVKSALGLAWTRDPFDRLLAAHSAARRLPLCTADGNLRRHHRLLPAELAGEPRLSGC